jgi:hypothetical protein
LKTKSVSMVVHGDAIDGDLDSFVAGICDGLQPLHANSLPHLREEDWADLPKPTRPSHALGFRDDRAISIEHRPPPPPTTQIRG